MSVTGDLRQADYDRKSGLCAESPDTASAQRAASTGRALPRRCWPAIAERGADASGTRTARPRARRRAQAAHAARAPSSIGSRSRRRAPGLLHVRDYTKGHPQIAANNHPVRHGAVVGVHNGTILNDDELMARLRLRAGRAGDDGRLRGDLRDRRGDRQRRPRASRTSAARWPPPGSTSGTRSCSTSRAASAGRSGSAPPAASSSSPPPSEALEIAEHYTGVRLRKRELAEGNARSR